MCRSPATPGAQYSLVVTRGANFDIHPNGTPDQAEPLTGTHGVLGAITVGSGAAVGASFDGIDFNDSSCGCLPPDTNAAVSADYVLETVNIALRIFDKQGNVLLTEPFSQFFAGLNPVQFSDPYVEYDDIAQRWYIIILDTGNSGILMAVSNDSNPLDGFSAQHRFTIGGGDFIDFDKMGYNADGVFITGNDFSVSGANPVLVSVDKSTILSGAASTFVNYITFPETVFRALVPAQMHGAKPGDPIWLVSTDGSVFSGVDSTTIRVTEITDALSASPTVTLTSVPVSPFQQPPGGADQPGAPGSVAVNDATVTQVDFRNGKLATTFTVSEPDDNYSTARVRWVQIDVSSGTPTLIQEGSVHPGPGVSTYFGTIAQDKNGDLGLTWMESSLSEYVSMYIAGQQAGSTPGTLSPGFAAAPGQAFMPESSREGDYSSVAVDPSDGLTFWAANEYTGSDPNNDIWATHIASFNLLPPVVDDWYSVFAASGSTITIATTTPGDGPHGVGNALSLQVNLYDPSGNLVATGVKTSDGRNETLTFVAPADGLYTIRVENDTNKGGNYFLSLAVSPAVPKPLAKLSLPGGGNGAAGPVSHVAATVPKAGPGVKDASSAVTIPQAGPASPAGTFEVSTSGGHAVGGGASTVALLVSRYGDSLVAEPAPPPAQVGGPSGPAPIVNSTLATSSSRPKAISILGAVASKLVPVLVPAGPGTPTSGHPFMGDSLAGLTAAGRSLDDAINQLAGDLVSDRSRRA